jgi:RND superfamily putative drug exporter
MACAFAGLAMSDLVTIRQLGAGLTIAVVLDALLVRPVLLPAAIAVLGRRAWWPTWRGRRRHRAGEPFRSSPAQTAGLPRFAARMRMRPSEAPHRRGA